MVSATCCVARCRPCCIRAYRLRLPDLLQATDHYADDVLSGRYDHLLPAGGLPTQRPLVRRGCTATTNSTSG